MVDLKILSLLLIAPFLNAHTFINIEDYVSELASTQNNGQTFAAHPDALLSIDKFLKKYNYPLESHEVTTEDHYILTIHRIPHGREEENKIAEDPENPKPVVFILHGLLSSSMDFVNMGPSKALALLLADEGYDVWLGNSRGNTWSRAHETLDPDAENTTFFDFSLHEMSVNDLPASIDYILNETGVSQISYVGHSQGTTQFFILGSEKTEYNDKINVMVALAPVAYWIKLSHPLLRLLKGSFDKIFEYLKERNTVEVLKHNSLLTAIIVKEVCQKEQYAFLCSMFVELLGGFDSKEWDSNFASVIVSNDPAGASVKQMRHYAQHVVYGKFRQFDYGVLSNMEIYNSSTPPDYDVSKITANVKLFYSDNDWFASLESVEMLASQLKNVEKFLVPFQGFSHLDFIFAKDIYSLLNVDVINALNQANNLPPLDPISTTTDSDTTTTKDGSTTTDDGPTTTDDDSTTTDDGSTTTDGGSTTTDDGSTTTDEPSDNGNGSWILHVNFALLVGSLGLFLL